VTDERIRKIWEDVGIIDPAEWEAAYDRAEKAGYKPHSVSDIAEGEASRVERITASLEENAKLGYVEFVGLDAKGERQYRLTDKGRQRAEMLVKFGGPVDIPDESHRVRE
jgi:hypothetical protein